MTLQIIKSANGINEYVLLPYNIYNDLRTEIDAKLKKSHLSSEYVPFDAADYVDNPVALARIKASVSQEQLAALMKVSQAYISKIENQDKVTAKLLHKVKAALEKHKK